MTTTQAPPAAPTAVASGAGLTRPTVDATICTPRWAREGSGADLTLTLFARSREAPVPIQIIANPTHPSFDAFALVERFFVTPIARRGAHTITINGTSVALGTYPNGNGEAQWKLADGSIAYLRSRGLSQDTIESIVEHLSPRDRQTPVPGFDLRTDLPEFALVQEHLNTHLTGRSATSECQVPTTGYVYRLSMLDGDPVYEYAGVIDGPVPVEVGRRDGTVIVVRGVPSPAAPTVAEIIDADVPEWARLLTRPIFEGS